MMLFVFPGYRTGAGNLPQQEIFRNDISHWNVG